MTPPHKGVYDDGCEAKFTGSRLFPSPRSVDPTLKIR